ncbi:MAG: hypothetical protein ACYCW6_10705 [Candidatus Xenobia bacterium]
MNTKLKEQPVQAVREPTPPTWAEWLLSGLLTNAILFLAISMLILGFLLMDGR